MQCLAGQIELHGFGELCTVGLQLHAPHYVIIHNSNLQYGHFSNGKVPFFNNKSYQKFDFLVELQNANVFYYVRINVWSKNLPNFCKTVKLPNPGLFYSDFGSLL